VIPTFNVERLIGDCLESVRWADEIVVVDMFSTDATQEICARYPNCRFFSRRDYIFGNVNFGIEQTATDWVIRLDSDERITPALRDEILGVLAAPPAGVGGFEFPCELFSLGIPLRHGFATKPYRKMMFRRGTARYEVQSEHEDLATTGEFRRLRHTYLHYNYLSVSQYLQKTDYYTTKDAERTEVLEQPRVRDALLEISRAMWLNYVRRGGWRDGPVGFIDAGMRAVYQFAEWAKRWESWHRARSGYAGTPGHLTPVAPAADTHRPATVAEPQPAPPATTATTQRGTDPDA
jgi:glycosyltransferase involved in cell wall biosynthesis